MKRWTAFCVGLACCAVLTPDVRAQFGTPSIPGIPSAPTAGLGGIPAAPAGLGTSALPTTALPTAVPASSPQTLWGFLGLSKANCAACKAKFCQSQLGSLATNGLKPFSALTGGIIPSNCCPPLSASQLAAGDGAGGDGPGSVAAKIQADEAGAKARIAAIEYLATVDCTYWPEAGEALIKSLRADRNECVRFAAARALGTGCCCTKDTIAALTLTVTSSKKDDNPAESSERVKAAAYYALQRCCACVQPAAPAPAPERPGRIRRPENPVSYESVAEDDGHSWVSPYKAQLAAQPLDRVVADARRALAASANLPLGEKTMPTGSRSVYHVLARASLPPAAANPTKPETPAPAAPRRESRPAAPADPSVVPTSARSQRPAATTSASVAPQSGQRSLFEILLSSRKLRQGS